MKQYTVTGMTCVACQARVEKAVSAVPGVTACTVSLLTNSMGVEGTAAEADIIRAVENAGYGAAARGKADTKREMPVTGDMLEDRATPMLLKRFLTSLGFLLVLLYFSMGQTMLHLPLPPFFRDNPTAVALAQMLLAAAVMLINRRFFVSGFRSALRLSPNMDTLVALGSSASFVWSLVTLFRMTADPDPMLTETLYFESAAMILVLITVGKMLEARSKGKTTDALRSLLKLAPETANVIRDGQEVTVPAEAVEKGDILVIRPGESIPADGIIREGHTAVNESALTGESIPAEKGPGDTVSAATVNTTGRITVEATRVGEDTALAEIIRLVSDAAVTKAPAARLADRVSGVFVPAVVGIAAVTLTVWLVLGQAFDFALARAISVLVISCPCALGLATPVAIMVGNGVGAKSGILFKTASALEETGKATIAVLDKTGTVTKGEPEVTAMDPADGVTGDELLSIAYALERESEHPLARAVVREAEKRGIVPRPVTKVRVLPGSGLTAFLDGEKVTGGSEKYMALVCTVPEDLKTKLASRTDAGMTPMVFAVGGRCVGAVAAADSVREESAEAVAAMKRLGIVPVLLTGDAPRTAKAVGERVGIRHVIAGVRPDEKGAIVTRLKAAGRTVMVGDGINDAPALTAADIGIAIGAGTDVAIDAANVVLMKSRLSDVPAAIRLSRATLTNIRQNLFWAFFYNIICIPLAAGCWTALFGWQLNPMIGAAAMSLSSFCVVSNALRLNLVRPDSGRRDRALRGPAADKAVEEILHEIMTRKENETMKKTMRIEGMMCMHCEARVKKTLEAIDGVAGAEVSHTAGNAVVTLSKDVDGSVLKAAVEAQDYKVLSVD